ncbi:MAG: TerD family protein [Lachnospiraceae bacterium]
MAVSLQKGQKISLTKENPNLDRIMVGLGWDMAEKGANIDCDASVLLLRDGKLKHKHKDVICFHHLKHKTGAVQHMGDNLTGAGRGDDEQILVELSKMPEDCDRVVFVVNIFCARSKKQHFGMIQNCFIRLINRDNGEEICKYNLSSENYDGKTAMIFGEVYRYGNEWKFNAIGEGTIDTGLRELCKRFA